MIDDITYDYGAELGITPSENPKNFSVETISSAFDQQGNSCRVCGRGDVIIERIPHHIYFKSQIGLPLVVSIHNAAVICKHCHRIIHQPSTNNEIAQSATYDRKLKLQALAEFNDCDDDHEVMELYAICKRLGYIDAAFQIPNIDGIMIL